MFLGDNMNKIPPPPPPPPKPDVVRPNPNGSLYIIDRDIARLCIVLVFFAGLAVGFTLGVILVGV